jgi:hypothetical protein
MGAFKTSRGLFQSIADELYSLIIKHFVVGRKTERI